MNTDKALFRSEVINKKRDENAFGEVVLIRPVSFTIYTLLLLIFVVSLGTFLYFGHYSSKETVRGMLNPQSGLVKVYAPKRGIIIEREVFEGDVVKKGDVIYSVSTEQHLSGGANLQSLKEEEIFKSIEINESEIKEQKHLNKLKKVELKFQKKHIEKEIESIKREIGLHEKRIALFMEEMKLLEKASSGKFIPKSNYMKSHQAHLASQLELEQLRRHLTNKVTEKQQAESELKRLPIELKQKILSYEKSLSHLRQELAEVNGNGNYSILAPAAGRVTSLLYDEGDTINPQSPLLTILPDDIPLKADLYVPTRAAGFLHVGQKVKIRFDAFPYQKFGLHDGVIEQVSGNVITSNDVALPIEIQEPVYKVLVKLQKQSITAFGREHYLQVGMLLQGDLIKDRSRIINWIVEPLYNLRGRT